MTNAPDSTIQTPFARWLFAQAKSDKDRQMPYASIYRYGKALTEFFGLDGRFDAEHAALELARIGADAEDLAALASAEAAWRVDTMVDNAEAAGVVLNLPETDDVAKMGTELELTEAKVLCGYRNHRGEGCINDAVPGAGRCGTHGGGITDPEVRRSFLLVAFAKVIDGSRVAVDALLDVAENGRSEMARVQAAKEILDRAGVSQEQQVTHIHAVETGNEDELLEALKNRLLETKNRLRLTAVEAATGVDLELQRASSAMVPVEPRRHAPDSEIIDAVIVEDDAVVETR